MIKRITIFFFTFMVIYLFDFFIPRLMPGDPLLYTSSVSGEDMNVEFSKEQLEQMRAYYGLDEPVIKQLISTVKKNLQGDMGLSIHYKKPVSDVLTERLPWSLSVMGTSLILSLFTGTALALWGMQRHRADQIIYHILSGLTEVPAYLIGLLLLFFVAAKVSWIPLSGGSAAFARYGSAGEMVWDLVSHAMLPILSLVLVMFPRFYFTARASFLEVMGKPYLLNANAKGLKDGRIRWRYIFRNGMTPVVARFFLEVGTAVGGTLLIENVFAYPGLGLVMREAVRYRDYMMIQGFFLLSTGLVLTSLFLADMINGRIDRRKTG
ncbi:MAG: ABC transporter permease [Clostridium sp.]|nr:ABC transporter permease [Clostridium sp.]